MRPSGSVVSKTANYTLTTSDCVVKCDGTFTITLPTAVGAAGTLYVVNNIGFGTITVATTSSQTINGELTQLVEGQYSSMSVVSDGSNWNIV